MANKLLERTQDKQPQGKDNFVNPTPSSARRKHGAIWMSIIALCALYLIRSAYDPVVLTIIECATLALIIWLAARQQRLPSHSGVWSAVGFSFALCFGWCTNIVALSYGYGNGNEVVALGSIGWLGLALSSFSIRRKHLGLSVVCSGFLTLFLTSISDHKASLVFAAIWGAMCIWWLIANHWESIAATAVVNVERPRMLKLNVLALIVCCYSPYLLRPRSEYPSCKN